MAYSTFQFDSLALGGADGGIYQGVAAKTGLECHVLQILEDTTFTVLKCVDGYDNEIDMLSSSYNNLDGISIPANTTLGCWDNNRGGHFTEITISAGSILRHTLPDTRRS